MPKLIVTDDKRFKCSACDQFFTPPPVPRGARPWTPEEARMKLAGEFSEHAENAHFRSRTKDGSDRIRPEERP
jgi:hypothetical protein